MNGAAFIDQKKPNKKRNTDYEKYNGYLQIYSHKPKGIVSKQGLLIEFFFTTNKKSTDFTEISFQNVEESWLWDKYITMGIDFKAKELKAFREFKGAYLGMYLEYLKKEFGEVKKAENTVHADIPKYNNCDVYTCEIENPEIDGINIENIYYYFYKNRLLRIQCSIDQNITREEEDLFIENLKPTYSEYTLLNKDDKVSPKWIYKSVGFEIRMMYKREIKSLVFSFESLADALINKN